MPVFTSEGVFISPVSSGILAVIFCHNNSRKEGQNDTARVYFLKIVFIVVLSSSRGLTGMALCFKFLSGVRPHVFYIFVHI